MAYQQEEERTRLGKRLSQEAINLAILGRWEEAVAANKSIIEWVPNDVGAYNRLGGALTELGKFAEAREAYSKALELAPENVIATKNLARLASLSESATTIDGGRNKVASELFITETGKAGVVHLENLASTEVLARMGVGAQVHLRLRGQRLVVEDEYGEYLGEVEPRHGLRLSRLMQGGNRYAAAILSLGESGVQVIVRELYQDPSQAGRPSFPTAAIEHLRAYIAESPPPPKIASGENEAHRVSDYVDVEGEDSSEDDEKALLEGFSVIEETGEEGGI